MINPKLLTKNDKAIIIAPAGSIQKKSMDIAIDTLKKWGLKVALAKNLYAKYGSFAGNDNQRLADFQQAIDNPEIKLILCARGGYGLSRYVDYLCKKNIKKYPKWIVGFSDITAFHLAFDKENLLTIHGPMGTSFANIKSNKSIQKLHTLLFKGISTIRSNKAQIKFGKASGCLVGGNLSLICDSLGTKSEIDTADKILILEDTGDYYYRIDRMLNQLKRAGKFDKLKGLVIGNFSKILGKNLFNETVIEMIVRLTKNNNYPIATSMPIGHQTLNYPFVHGGSYELNVQKNDALLKLKTIL